MPPLESGKTVNFQNVLVASDFSPAAETALLHALAFARRWHARVVVAHIVSPSAIFGQESVQRTLNDAWREAHRSITNHLIAGHLEGVENRVVVRQGEMWPELEKVAEEFQADLLVTGTRGRSGVLKVLLGSTAETVFRQSTIPVLTVGPRVPEPAPTDSPGRVLYSTGFAAQSLYASRFAFAIAARHQAPLAMVHVLHDTAENSGATRDRLHRESADRLRQLVPANLGLAGAPEVHVRFGSTAETILAMAEQLHPDVIVLGLRRHSQGVKPAVWTTAYTIVSNAPCPVLTVRTPEELS
jgi:nucleotide-binding universal stress UspA family protein